MKKDFLRFMASPLGRAGRVVVGLGLLTTAMFFIQSALGILLTIAALVPIAGGLFDFCIVGALMGYPMSGAKLRRILPSR